MKESEIRKLVAVFTAAFPHYEVTPETYFVWDLAMNEPTPIPFEAAMFAARKYIPVAKWFPKPVEIRDIVAEHVCGIPSTTDAWQQVERSMKQNYPGMPVKYTPDALVLEAAREIGGIHTIRNAKDEWEFSDLRKRFATRYEAMRRDRVQVVDIAERWTALQPTAPDNLRSIGERAS